MGARAELPRPRADRAARRCAGHLSRRPARPCAATPDQTVAAVSELAAQEREQVKRQIRLRARLTLVIGLILFAAQIAASKLFADNGLYGLPQILTAGMLGFTGALIGGAVYTLKNARRL